MPQDVGVPQRWFWHFYAVGAAWNAMLLVAFGGALCTAEVGSQGPSVWGRPHVPRLRGGKRASA